jgi:protein phosphatase
MTKTVEVPDFALIVLIGATGSGKSTFTRKHFLGTEIISSDHARGLVSDSENDQSVTTDAFELVRVIAEKRLKHRRLAVIDATNVRAPERKPWIEIARKWHALPVAIVLDPGPARPGFWSRRSTTHDFRDSQRAGWAPARRLPTGVAP